MTVKYNPPEASDSLDVVHPTSWGSANTALLGAWPLFQQLRSKGPARYVGCPKKYPNLRKLNFISTCNYHHAYAANYHVDVLQEAVR